MMKLSLIFAAIVLSVFIISCSSDDPNPYANTKNSIYSSSVYQLHLDTNNLQIKLFINDLEVEPQPYGYQTDSSNQYFDGRNKLVLNRFLIPGDNSLRIEFAEPNNFKDLTEKNKALIARKAFASLILVEGVLIGDSDAVSAQSARKKLELDASDVKPLINKLYRKFIPETMSQLKDHRYTFNVDPEGFTQFSSDYCELVKSSDNIESAELTLNSYSALKIEASNTYTVPSLFAVGEPINKAELHVYALSDAGRPGSLRISTDCELIPLFKAKGISDDIIKDINGYGVDWRDTRFPLVTFNIDRIGVHLPQ